MAPETATTGTVSCIIIDKALALPIFTKRDRLTEFCLTIRLVFNKYCISFIFRAGFNLTNAQIVASPVILIQYRTISIKKYIF